MAAQRYLMLAASQCVPHGNVPVRASSDVIGLASQFVELAMLELLSCD